MPSGQTTVTAPIGPALTASAQVLAGVRRVSFDSVRAVLDVETANGRVVSYDINATTTITATAASGVFTFTVSQ